MLMIEWDGVFASINEDKIEWVYVDESIYSPPVPEVRFPFIVNTPCFVPECAASDSVAPTFFVHLDFLGMDETSRKDGKDRLAFHAEISVIDDEKSDSMGKRARGELLAENMDDLVGHMSIEAPIFTSSPLRDESSKNKRDETLEGKDNKLFLRVPEMETSSCHFAGKKLL